MESQEKALGKQFRKQLAACVRSIQWSYAIFWSLSTSQEGMLDWNDGFYNGDIKTRKTTQLTDCKEDQMGLQRSEHLRELYESLSTVESNEQNRRPSASLSPEDLTDTEWYYMICMSFTFPLGQDLPGKVYELNEPVWLSNAQFAEKRSFSRCLLAKSACIQTIVGLPFMDGVLEIGTSELVLEDPGFVQTIRSSFWDFQDPVSTEHSTSSSPLVGKEDENICTILDHEVDEAVLLENHLLDVENDSHEFRFDVNSYAPSKQTELMHSSATELHSSICDKFAGTPVGLSNELSNGLPGSFKCSDECAPWPFAQNILPSPRGERVKGNMLDHQQESNQANFSSFGADSDGSHYASTLSTILGSSKQQMTSPIIPLKNCSDKYSFKTWKRGSRNLKIFCRMPQRMLKKLLIDCKWMNGDQVLKPQEEVFSRNKTWKSEAEDTNANHVLSERRRREKLNEKFLVLRSLVPSISKVDKTSILADTIEYIKELERRVEELESYGEEASLETKPTRRHPDIAERTSDNYGENDGRRPWSSSKRKACEIDETDDDHQRPLSKNGLVDINITVIEKAVLIEMQCPWRDSLLLDIVETMSKLRLDAQSVQSSSVDGTLVITLRSKCMAEVVASPGMIKRALQRVVSRC